MFLPPEKRPQSRTRPQRLDSAGSVELEIEEAKRSTWDQLGKTAMQHLQQIHVKAKVETGVGDVLAVFDTLDVPGLAIEGVADFADPIGDSP